ncbi:Clavaminate synthase-like protein [Panaeolus papilionaceus]|nr:Clavaminate synthase-like protein [Panaeolus papilionaceus]
MFTSAPPSYTPAPVTEAKLDYADLPLIDLSLSGTAEGRAQLARQVHDAMCNQGFFYVINHGLDKDQTKRMFDIADVVFSQLSDEEKVAYAANIKATGSYQGFKLRQYWSVGGGVKDQIEHYNINRDITKKPHPPALQPYLPEIEAFARHNHENVLHPVLRLLALGLELPENTLADLHGYSDVGETYVRYMKYYPRSKEEEEKSNNVWLKGHTDFGTITILYSQPVAALQILTPEGNWKWVKHIDNALVINAGDAMEFLSGGYYRGTIHRVVQPPPDQQSYTRLGVFYFAMPNDDVVLAPLLESPVLQRVGVKDVLQGKQPPTMKEWRMSRTAAYGQTNLIPKGNGVEEEVINGVVVKHYT